MQYLPLLAVLFYFAGLFRRPFIFAGLLSQFAYLFGRGAQLGRLPIVGPHDTLFFMSASTVFFGLPIFYALKKRTAVFYPVIGLAVVLMLASFFFPPHDRPLPPVLKTFWFESHVALSFFSYALFGIAAALGASWFVSGKTRDIEIVQYKTILVGYALFSTAMIFGGIWAFLAWGTYWLWTPKELWTVILWLFYSLYLHARLTKNWGGSPSIVLGITGFFVVMFTYLGVSLLMKSSHTF